jgi:peptidoglycan-associated lipoprotein
MKYSFFIILKRRVVLHKVNIFIGLAVVLSIVMMAGCSKKATKIEQTLDKPAVTVQPVTAPEPQPATLNEDRTQDILVPIYFGFDSYALRQTEIGKLERIASLLSEKSALSVVCEGHCDERGSQEYNMGLGENRARAIKQWLTAYGIADGKIETTSFGKERPVVSNCSDDPCHAQNRRAEWRILTQ